MIQAYFAQVKEIVDQYGVTNFVLEARVNFELRPAGQGYLTGVFTFVDGVRPYIFVNFWILPEKRWRN